MRYIVRAENGNRRWVERLLGRPRDVDMGYMGRWTGEGYVGKWAVSAEEAEKVKAALGNDVEVRRA